jgi:RNA polymerase sigma factor (sigma-70 family)
MPPTPRAAVLDSLDRLFGAGSAAGLDDAELLRRYVDDGDESAFESLVERHGPLVLHVCRRYLRDPEAISDAFQATFLILIRRAPSVRDRRLLGNWLYGVASRVSLRARSHAWTRSRRESTLDTLDFPSHPAPDPLCQSDDHRLLHEELARLPAKYRTPLVLCYLQGQTHEQAAARLKWPVGTVRGRLHRAREMLRSRLSRRGLASPVPLIASALKPAMEPLPFTLLRATRHLAPLAWAGPLRSLAPGVVPAATLTLARGESLVMLLNFWKLPAAGLAAAGLFASGASLGFPQDSGTKPAEAPSAAASATPAVVIATDPVGDPDAEDIVALADARLAVKQAELSAAEARMIQAQAEIDRIQNVMEKLGRNGVSTAERAKAAAEVSFAKANVAQAQAELRESEILKRQALRRLEAGRTAPPAAAPPLFPASPANAPPSHPSAPAPAVALVPTSPLATMSPHPDPTSPLATMSPHNAAPPRLLQHADPSAREHESIIAAAPSAPFEPSHDSSLDRRLSAIEAKLDRILERLDAGRTPATAPADSLDSAPINTRERLTPDSRPVPDSIPAPPSTPSPSSRVIISTPPADTASTPR